VSSEKLRVGIAELRAAVNDALNQIEKHAGEYLEFTEDYFWSVSQFDLFDPTRDPELTLGQLAEELEWIRSNERDPAPSPYQLVWIASLFRALGLGRYVPVKSGTDAAD
jgi:hypothetical protein